MLKAQGIGLVFLLGTCFVLLEWLHQFPVLTGKAFTSDHVSAAERRKTDLEVGRLRRLRSGNFEVNGFFPVEDVRDRGSRIPKILHQIYLDGEDVYQSNSANDSNRLQATWRDGCRRLHNGWQIHFWDLDKAEGFLQKKAAWFLPAFRALPKTVLKGDVLRPFLMYHIGGMYLDIDVECYRPADPILVGWDMVLQSEYSEGQDISNAVLASAPGLPYWEALIEAAAAAADAIANKRRLDAMDVLHATGPPLYTQVFKQVAHPHAANNVVGAWKLQNAWVRVYGLDSFFVPCVWMDRDCHEAVTKRHLSNAWIQDDLVGHHHYLGSWLADVEPVKQS
ncbi:hypothetical protein WJX74_007528 [Apatococcus lobatus]|uniref:Glycosyltransferase family 32 protein n=1 Tax=Apatococcus lobatus TaxID=904363 RepID=A0AAW1PV36_9CHLO